jgi:hypothetical protein
VSKMRNRFSDRPEVYKTFLEILHRYKEGSQSVESVREEVARFFEGHEDLLEEFRHFLPDKTVRTEAARPATGDKKESVTKVKGKPGPKPKNTPSSVEGNRQVGGLDPALLAKFKRELDKCRGSYAEFSKCVSLFLEDVWSGAELIGVIEGMMTTEKLKDLFAKLKVAIQARAKVLGSQTTTRVGDLNFAGCPKAGTSYKKLPKDYVSPACSSRTAWHSSILNDRWVALSSGSEDYSFKDFRRNQYEMSLFKCEDDRYELDMLIERTAGAVRCLSALQEGIGEGAGADAVGKNSVVGTLKPQHIGLIDMVYGDNATELLDNIDRAPHAAIPVLLQRLRQKHAEWCKARRDMNKIWREVYKDNYYKSLDHRSFYFKQVDKKNTSAKAFWQEITAAKRQAHFNPGTSARLVYEMGEKEVHKDLLRVVVSAAKGREDKDGQVVRMFEMFVYTFLGFRDRNEADLAFVVPRQPSSSSRTPSQEASGSVVGGAKDGADAGGRCSNGGVEEEVEETVEGVMQRVVEGAQSDGQMDYEGADDEREGVVRPKPKLSRAGSGDSAKDWDGKGSDDGKDSGSEELDEDFGTDIWHSVHCMPLYEPVNPVEGAQERQNTGESEKWDGNLLYGDLHIYVFFRLYQKLYERLLIARDLSRGNAAKSHQPSSSSSTSSSSCGPSSSGGGGGGGGGSGGNASAATASSPKEDKEGAGSGSDAKDEAQAQVEAGDERSRAGTGDGSVEGGGNGKDAAAAAAAAAGSAPAAASKEGVEGYEKFLAMLCDVVAGECDSSKFEDCCSVTLGTSSFHLFTLEGLVERLLRHTELLLGVKRIKKNGGGKFLSLYEYELARRGGMRKDLYETNAFAMLSDGGFFAVYCDKDTHKLSMELLELKDAHVLSGDSSKIAAAHDSFLGGTRPREAAGSKSAPFLARNVRGAVLGGGGEGDGALAGVIEGSDLSMHVSHETGTLEYDKGTCDYMHRDHSVRARSRYDVDKRVEKMRTWQEKRLEMVPIEAAEEEKQKRMADMCDIMAREALEDIRDTSRLADALERARAVTDVGEQSEGQEEEEEEGGNRLEILLNATTVAEGEAGKLGSPMRKRKRREVQALLDGSSVLEDEAGRGGRRRAKEGSVRYSEVDEEVDLLEDAGEQEGEGGSKAAEVDEEEEEEEEEEGGFMEIDEGDDEDEVDEDEERKRAVIPPLETNTSSRSGSVGQEEAGGGGKDQEMVKEGDDDEGEESASMQGGAEGGDVGGESDDEVEDRIVELDEVSEDGEGNEDEAREEDGQGSSSPCASSH